ncbi:MAG: UDP-N-acetylmuramate dehydrogenase [Zoogloeaceae bacterium]|jgi:UDP-N-acetylmuramate dehydrogenase|nr:UDP-N-acetylmuramate dehydrogenase [Zoogloeaceae bacterium]
MKPPDCVTPDADLQPLNTLSLPGRAAFFAKPKNAADLALLRATFGRMRRFILGGGSNLVLTGDFDGLMIGMVLQGKAVAGEDADAVYVRAAGGERWHDFVAWTQKMGFYGLENLAGIPGTVGAAPVQNIGAYGVEVGDFIHRLRLFDWQTGEMRVVTQKACAFGYRDSAFKREGFHQSGRLMIVEVVFRLPKMWVPKLSYGALKDALSADQKLLPTPEAVMEAVLALRAAKLPDPASLPNAGSFFHNPQVEGEQLARLLETWPDMPFYRQPQGRAKLLAAWLIEQAGWKGRDLGPVGMYEKQALVLVNRGSARYEDLLRLRDAVQAAVAERFGVALTPEPVFC